MNYGNESGAMSPGFVYYTHINGTADRVPESRNDERRGCSLVGTAPPQQVSAHIWDS